MLFLADESCDFAVVRALRAAGHDVSAVADISPQADDEYVLELARQEERVLLTEDKDFGQLVFADQRATGGVILTRYPATARSALAGDVVQLVADRGGDLVGRFVVIRPGRCRLGPKKA
jgi:predicted nuclease of predicted toxin-antitoxin system